MGAAISKAGSVVHIRRIPYQVYIGRPSKWGNPFHIGKDAADAKAVLVMRKRLLYVTCGVLAYLGLCAWFILSR